MPKKKTQHGAAAQQAAKNDPFYAQVKRMRADQKRQKEEKHQLKSTATQPASDTTNKRGINYQIKKNKGLTPHRKKENRNARVKYRNKYTKALKKYNHHRPGVKKDLNPVAYGGESSGINPFVVKSISLS
ncbi:Something about silencing protein 10 [Balamuthia mandrillaris]